MSSNWKSLVTDGFVRNITKTINQISPIAINKLCLDYIDETIVELKVQLKQAQEANDHELIIEIEKGILWETAYQSDHPQFTYDQILWSHQEALIEVLHHWKENGKLYDHEFREMVIEATYRCIQNDSSEILEILLEHSGHHQITKYDNHSKNKAIIKYINHASKYASFKCIELLLKTPNKLNWETQKRPICLLNAIKYNVNNIELIDLIIKKLESVNIRFICDDIMTEAVNNDSVYIVKRLISYRWHTGIITEDDQLRALSINGECHRFFVDRSEAFNFIDELNQNQHFIDLDDEEWEDNDSNDDFSEDNDWEMCVDE